MLHECLCLAIQFWRTLGAHLRWDALLDREKSILEQFEFGELQAPNLASVCCLGAAF